MRGLTWKHNNVRLLMRALTWEKTNVRLLMRALTWGGNVRLLMWALTWEQNNARLFMRASVCGQLPLTCINLLYVTCYFHLYSWLVLHLHIEWTRKATAHCVHILVIIRFFWWVLDSTPSTPSPSPHPRKKGFAYIMDGRLFRIWILNLKSNWFWIWIELQIFNPVQFLLYGGNKKMWACSMARAVFVSI